MAGIADAPQCRCACIICDGWTLLVRDRATAAQDLFAVDTGFCDGLIDAARRRLETRGR
jgi:hypothetical protein